MASMKRVVATGRMMNGRDGLTPEEGDPDAALSRVATSSSRDAMSFTGVPAAVKEDRRSSALTLALLAAPAPFAAVRRIAGTAALPGRGIAAATEKPAEEALILRPP